MHIPDSDLFETIFQLKRLLKPRGTAFISVSAGRAGVDPAGRARGGRLFRERSAEELLLLFERVGFRLTARYETPDVLEREMLWCTLVFQLEDQGAVRSLDQVATIIRRDRKVATYKLALLRALCDIAQTGYRKALWYTEGLVGIPLGLVAEKWLFYYWPLVEPDIGASGAVGPVAFPQQQGAERNRLIAFRPALRELIRHYARLGGLTSFAQDYSNQRLDGTAAALADAALNAIANTIVVGPVRYAGGALAHEGRFFSFRGRRQARGRCFTAAGLEAALGEVLLPAPVWREIVPHRLLGFRVHHPALGGAFCGHVRQARANRGSRRTAPGAPGCGQGCPGRAAGVRRTWIGCAASGRAGRWGPSRWTTPIPFSLWFNSELWNLLPAARSVNLAKKDRLVSRPTLLGSRDRIIDYWRYLRSTNAKRFELEIGRSLLGRSPAGASWEMQAFCGLSEAIETIALQRGVERWSA